MVSWGSQSPVSLNAFSPASTSIHSMDLPCLAAAASSTSSGRRPDVDPRAVALDEGDDRVDRAPTGCRRRSWRSCRPWPEPTRARPTPFGCGPARSGTLAWSGPVSSARVHGAHGPLGPSISRSCSRRSRAARAQHLPLLLAALTGRSGPASPAPARGAHGPLGPSISRSCSRRSRAARARAGSTRLAGARLPARPLHAPRRGDGSPRGGHSPRLAQICAVAAVRFSV